MLALNVEEKSEAKGELNVCDSICAVSELCARARYRTCCAPPKIHESTPPMPTLTLGMINVISVGFLEMRRLAM